MSTKYFFCLRRALTESRTSPVDADSDLRFQPPLWRVLVFPLADVTNPPSRQFAGFVYLAYFFSTQNPMLEFVVEQ
jgi:hypothetical protein